MAERFIQTVVILNKSEEHSTILSSDLFERNDAESYIISDCDEEILILIRFKQMIALKNIVFHATEIKANNDASSPKQIHLYKLQNLNVNFDDISAMKPAKTLKCSSNKLLKGQKFKLHKNLKFKKIQYLAIHIGSNQNDTELTYLNDICFNIGCDNNSTQVNEQKRLENDEKRLYGHLLKYCSENLSTSTQQNIATDSSHLLKPYNLYSCDSCELKECAAFRRISKVLCLYYQFIIEEQKISNDHLFGDEYNNVHLLNDFTHLLFSHSTQDEFERICDSLVGQIKGNCCNIGNCVMLRRNHCDRSSKKLYFNKDEGDIVRQTLLDRIHSYYLHSFDIGHKLRKVDRDRILNDDHEIKSSEDNFDEKIDFCYDSNISNAMRHIIRKQKSYADTQGLERLKNNEQNKFLLNTEDTSNTTQESQSESKSNNDKSYSFGYRYFYWKQFENDQTRSDFIQGLGSCSMKRANTNYTIADFYVTKKYDTFKDETISNVKCKLSAFQWNQLVKMAKIHLDSKHGRTFKCLRLKSAAYYDKKYGDTLTLQYLIAIMLYCNFDVLQFEFTKTYRKLNQTESVESMKERHRNFYFLGKLLTELVECYGMKRKSPLEFLHES
eukprot:292919_1